MASTADATTIRESRERKREREGAYSEYSVGLGRSNDDKVSRVVPKRS